MLVSYEALDEQGVMQSRPCGQDMQLRYCLLGSHQMFEAFWLVQSASNVYTTTKWQVKRNRCSIGLLVSGLRVQVQTYTVQTQPLRLQNAWALH